MCAEDGGRAPSSGCSPMRLELEGPGRARGGGKSWKASMRAIHRGRLKRECVREWREALVVAVAER